MIKSYKVRLYPTLIQEQNFLRHIGACRFIWNRLLDTQLQRYFSGEKYLSEFRMCNFITELKHTEEFIWLNDISVKSMQAICRELDQAYQAFFHSNSGFPKFKSKKRSKLSYPIAFESFYFIDDNSVNIEKIGHVKCKTDFRFNHGNHSEKFRNTRVYCDDGKWFISFCKECDTQALPLTDKPMGIDVGVRKLLMISYGDNEYQLVKNINKDPYIVSLEQRIKYYQRVVNKKYAQNKIGNKYVKTKNILKVEKKIRKLYKRLRNIRMNYIHQWTHWIITQAPSMIVMEDLNLIDMARNKTSKQRTDLQYACLGMILHQVKYKCELNGIPFRQVDRYYPSSKTCHNCGAKNYKLGSKEIFTCPHCGTKIDRDLNAAMNLRDFYSSEIE